MTFEVPPHALEIRPAGPEELESVLEVYRQCKDFLALGPVATASMEMVLKDMELSRDENGIYCGIYMAAGEMIGVLDYVLEGYRGEPRIAFIELLMLAAAYRGQGIGRAVLAALENEVRRDMDVIRLGVQVNNPQGLKFWQSIGFRIVSEPKLYPDQTTAVDMQKDIQQGRAGISNRCLAGIIIVLLSQG